MKQKLRNLVEDSSRIRMDREEDVLQYYRTFKHYSDPLVRSGHLTETKRDVEFWYGFHPHDRDILWRCLLTLYPFHRHDIPFHFENVFNCACRVFAYEERVSFRPREQEFEHPSISSRRYPSHPYTSDPRQFPSLSRLFSESQYTPAPSVTKIQPEPEPEPEFMPSIAPTSPSAPSLASSCTNNVLESKLEPISNTSTSPPRLPSSLSTSSCTNVVPEPESEQTIPSITLPNSPSLPLAPSLQSSCTDVVPEPKSISEHASLYSFPLTSPLLPSLSLPSSCTDAVAEHMTSSPSSISSTAFEYPLSSTRFPTKVQLAESASPITSTPPALLLSTFEASSLPSLSTLEPDPVLDVALLPDPWPDPSPLAESLSQPSMSRKFESTPAASAIDHVLLNPSSSSSESCDTIPVPSAPLEVSNTPMPSHPTLREQTLRVTPSEVVSMRLPLAARLTPLLEVSDAPVLPGSTSQEQTFEVTPHDVMHTVTSTTANAQLVLPLSSFTDCWYASPGPFSTISSSRFDAQSSRGKNVSVHPTPPLETSLSVFSPPHSSASQPPPRLVLLEDSNVPIPPHSMSPIVSPERKFGFTPVNSDSSTLDLTLVTASPTLSLDVTPQFLSAQQQLKLEDILPVFEVSSMLAPRLHCSSPHFAVASNLVTLVALVSGFLIVSATLSTLTRKFWRKNEHISNDRNDITMQGNTFDFTQLFQLAQYLPHAARLVFDPGGLVSVLTSHKDSRERKPITEDLQYSTATIVLGCSTLRHLC
jgi:hypothetical protein